MKLGSFQFELDSPPRAEDPSLYWDRVEELAAILHGTPWALAGGAAIAVTIGRFYRPHSDIDIVFPLSAFAQIEAAMRRADYELRTHFPWSMLGIVRGAVHVPLSASAALASGRMRKLKFRDVSGRRAPPLSVVEAFPYLIESDHVITCDGRHRFPLMRPVVGYRHVTRAGHEIPGYDLEYVAHYKWTKSEPKHAEDLAIIANHQPLTAPAGHQLARRSPVPS